MNNFKRLTTFTFKYFNYEKFVIKSSTIRTLSSGFYANSDVTLTKTPFNQFQFVRNYAKGKDKKKEKGKSKVVVNENEIASVLNIENLKKQLELPLEVMKNEYVKQLSLRTSAGSLELLTINFEGKDYTLQEIAQVVRKNPTTLVINMSIFPQAIPMVLKAIQKSGFNLNPQQEGTTLYVPIPKVTQEHRENLTKAAKHLFIKCKDSIRDTQNKHSKTLKRKDGLSEDLLRNVEQQIVAMADGYILQAEKIFNNKSKELLGKD
nr:ribosome-recycling factor, mitochondrial [Onthophagus taurus]